MHALRKPSCLSSRDVCQSEYLPIVRRQVTWKDFALNRGIMALVAIFLILGFSPLSSDFRAQELTAGRTPIYRYQVVRAYPHDPQAFTQGFVYVDGFFYEGTGLHGRSSLRKVDPASGRILKRIDLPSAFFGEGVTVVGSRIVQVTWQSQVGFIYDKKTFRLLKQFHYPHEGWGITHDGKRLFLSDGTSLLHILDPKNYRELARLRVYDERGDVPGLNELEYVRGDIYANIWPTNRLAVINSRTGQVKAYLNLAGLLSEQEAQGVDVVNGIAYDDRADRLFVTGKFWPKVFEIKVVKEK
jgi:glutaminyl-peptide cyclotransferase